VFLSKMCTGSFFETRSEKYIVLISAPEILNVEKPCSRRVHDNLQSLIQLLSFPGIVTWTVIILDSSVEIRKVLPCQLVDN
jgi:hypothetical protein